MIFNMVGGGAALNFKVEAYASELLLPATAKENTIAVITETPISGWSFSTDEPTEPVEGTVWFITSNTSPVPFSATKKNKLMVYPLAVEQYTSGAWTEKTAKSYQDGVWSDWLMYLYNLGDEFVSFTGGWEAKAYGNIKQTLTKKETTLYLVGTNASASAVAGIVHAEPLDLRPFSTLYVSVAGTNNTGTDASICLSDSYDLGSNFDQHLILKTSITSGGTKAIDISNIDSGCVCLVAYQKYLEVSKIWLE